MLLLALLAVHAPGPAAASWFDRLVDWLPWTPEPAVTCPPEGFDSVANFDINTYIEAPWYVQAQVPLIYQSKDQLFCVKATYKPINEDDPEAGVIVYNYANQGRVNGPSMGTSEDDDFLVALPAEHGSTSPTAASKLEVGPKAISGISFLRGAAFGPYWVVAVGESEAAAAVDEPPAYPGVTPGSRVAYDWAVVAGGAPDSRSNDACTTFENWFPTSLQYRGGLWIFTRDPLNADAAAAARQAAEDLGFDMRQLVDVQQEGCDYEGSVDV